MQDARTHRSSVAEAAVLLAGDQESLLVVLAGTLVRMRRAFRYRAS